MWVCSICNGLKAMENLCPTCATTMLDMGKVSDYYGDYSPYREIEDAKLSNGLLDSMEHQCIHYSVCPQCGLQMDVTIKEEEL